MAETTLDRVLEAIAEFEVEWYRGHGSAETDSEYYREFVEEKQKAIWVAVRG